MSQGTQVRNTTGQSGAGKPTGGPSTKSQTGASSGARAPSSIPKSPVAFGYNPPEPHTDALRMIERAIVAHAGWKRRLSEAAETRTCTISVEKASQDNQCEFGKWLYGNGANLSPREKGMEYEEVRQLHATFHQCAAKTLKLALEGDRIGYEAERHYSGDFTQRSADLTHAIVRWRARLRELG